MFCYSGIECKDEVFAAHQVQHADLKPAVAPILQVPQSIPLPVTVESPGNGDIVAIIQPKEERPIPVTELIFAPRKKEMNKGYLIFSPDQGRTSEWLSNFHSLGIRCCFLFYGFATLKFVRHKKNLSFSVLKDEPEDLTHLAPTAGDACIPLEDSTFDMFDDFILTDNYCSLLGDDLANESPDLTPDSLLLSSPEPQVNGSIILLH